VCINHGSNRDAVVQVIAYGWNDFGHKRLPHPHGQVGVELELKGAVTDLSKK
jgi:hypothetical protein